MTEELIDMRKQCNQCGKRFNNTAERRLIAEQKQCGPDCCRKCCEQSPFCKLEHGSDIVRT